MNNLLAALLIILPFAGWGLVCGLAWVWLRQTITPAWIRQLFESEGEASVRLVLAPVVVVYTLCMQAAGRIGEGMVQANYLLAATLLGLGTAKLVGKAFAHRPPAAPALVLAYKADIVVQGDATITNQGPA